MMLEFSTVLTFHYRWLRAMGENTFQPKIGFKTRYGLVANPFAGAIANKDNKYYRAMRVDNLL